MAHAPLNFPQSEIHGSFQEKDHGNFYQYIKTENPMFKGTTTFDCIIFVGPNGEETRPAKILKHSAYVVVGENEDGLIVEQWMIKHHNHKS